MSYMVEVSTIRSRITFFRKVKARSARHAALRAERKVARMCGESCIAEHVARVGR